MNLKGYFHNLFGSLVGNWGAYLGCALLFFSCTQPNKIYKVEPGLNQYVDSFFSLSDQRGKNFQKDNLIIKLTRDLVKLKGGLGVTDLQYINGHLGQRTIEFDYDFWINATESQRQTLSLHEFGHAYLSRSHTKGYSIMNVNTSRDGWPQCSGSQCDHEFLIDELFRNTGL